MRILLVEDETALADSVSRGLAADGIEVDWAENGTDGLWRAREGDYDVIVSDIMMPGLNGWELCQKLREEHIWTPLLMLSAKDGEYDEADSLDYGADDYLRKPFSHVVLVARLRSLARRAPQERPTVLGCGDLKVDPATMTCHRGATEIELTSREFSVLELLLRRAPTVVAKSQILNSVWGMDFAGDPNIVEVYIGYLRRKIDRPFGTETIQTVRGSGYKIASNGLSE